MKSVKEFASWCGTTWCGRERDVLAVSDVELLVHRQTHELRLRRLDELAPGTSLSAEWSAVKRHEDEGFYVLRYGQKQVGYYSQYMAVVGVVRVAAPDDVVSCNGACTLEQLVQSHGGPLPSDSEIAAAVSVCEASWKSRG